MSVKPIVSIVIPTYNRAAMIGSAIESALNQTYPDKEIIVVDDGSTDHTEEIVKGFETVNYVVQTHGGQAAARNHGWKLSKGFYFSTLDSDDVWQPHFLEKNIEILESKNLDFVFSNWQQEKMEGGMFDFFSVDDNVAPYLHKVVDGWAFLNHSELRTMYLKGCPSPSSSLVLRSSSIVEGWNKKMNIADDWCMILDIILSKETKAAFTTQPLWIKRINNNNIYDGRRHIEVNKLLWVNDMRTILKRHGKLLSKKEYTVIERKYLKNLVRSARHSLFFDFNILESLKLMRQALFTDPIYTSRIFSELFMEATKRRLKGGAH